VNSNDFNSENNNKNNKQILPAQNSSPQKIEKAQLSWSAECTTPRDTQAHFSTPKAIAEIKNSSPKKLSHKSSSSIFAPKSSTSVVSNINTVFKEKGSTIQTGMDRYVNIKRKLSPKELSTPSNMKFTKLNVAKQDDISVNNNRFAILADEEERISSDTVTKKTARPPPIYLREQCSSAIVNEISRMVGNKSFHVVPIRKGNIAETKIQIYEENNYRTIAALLDKNNKKYYTYQLKSSKGLIVVIKGIESNVDPEEVKSAIAESGFKVKSVYNIKNKENIPQPLFKIELEPENNRLKKNDVHPIYNLRYLLNRRVAVEEPHKRAGPVQCFNCQEYGHTKSYCTLRAVCVVCGEPHHSSECIKEKRNCNEKKCSNCGGNHTANYRGCPIYVELKSKNVLRSQKTPASQTPAPYFPDKQEKGVTTENNPFSYANILKSNANVDSTQNTSAQNNLESTINALTQFMAQFMTSMQNLMQEMIKTQNQMMQFFVSKQ